MNVVKLAIGDKVKFKELYEKAEEGETQEIVAVGLSKEPTERSMQYADLKSKNGKVVRHLVNLLLQHVEIKRGKKILFGAENVGVNQLIDALNVCKVKICCHVPLSAEEEELVEKANKFKGLRK